MLSLRNSQNRTSREWHLTRNLRSRLWTLALTAISLSILLALTGCLRGREVHTVQYVRSTQLPEELNGMMRLAQNKVIVNVIGTDKVGVFETVEASGYILIHEQDMAKFVRNTQRLQLMVGHLQKHHPEVLETVPQIREPKDPLGAEPTSQKEESNAQDRDQRPQIEF